MNELVTYVGVACLAISFGCYVATFFYLKPGQSIVQALMRGSFVRSQDYEPWGQTLLLMMRVLSWVAIVLIFAGVRGLFGS